MHNNTKTMVYKTSGFSEIVASPVFFAIVVLTILLGLASSLGYLSNPLKLKAKVDNLSAKVFKPSVSRYRLSLTEKEIPLAMAADRYSILGDSFTLEAKGTHSQQNNIDKNREAGVIQIQEAPLPKESLDRFTLPLSESFSRL